MRFTIWEYYPDRIGICKCWFLRRVKNRSTRRKTSRNKDENQQQTQPTYDAESGNLTRATLVGGECFHHCAIPAPLDQQIHLSFKPPRGALSNMHSFPNFLNQLNKWYNISAILFVLTNLISRLVGLINFPRWVLVEALVYFSPWLALIVFSGTGCNGRIHFRVIWSCVALIGFPETGGKCFHANPLYFDKKMLIFMEKETRF